MTADPWQLIAAARADGLRFSIGTDGAVKIAGAEDVRGQWLATLREHRQAIRSALDEERAVADWLDRMGETDEATRAEVLDCCSQRADVRAYFVGRAIQSQQENSR